VLNHCAVHANDATAAQKLSTYFPEAWQNLIISKFAGRHQRVRDERQRLKSYQVARYQDLFGNSQKLFTINHERLAPETQTIAQLFLVLELAGVDTRDFAMSQGPNAFLMSVPSNQDADLANNMALVAPDLFQRLSPKLMPASGYDYSWARFDCQSLQTESLQQLHNVKPAPLKSEVKLAPTVFGECMSCHSVNPGPVGAPPIPFDRTGNLRAYLQRDQNSGMKKILERVQKAGPGQMPPYRKLSADEVEQLRLNLERIGS
jgi:hypothetical protein